MASLTMIAHGPQSPAPTEAQYRFIIDNIKQVIFQTDARGRWTFLNAAWTEITGFTVAESLGTSFLRYVHPDDRQRHAELFQPLAGCDGDYFALEARYLTKAGGSRAVEVFAQLIFEGGSVTGIVGTLTDVTDTRRAEDERARLSSVVEQSAEAIVVTAPDASIVYVNPAFERLTGYTAAEVAGRTPSLLKSGKHDAAFYRALWQRLAEGEAWSGRFVNRRKDGSLFEAEAVVSPVRDASGAVVNYVGGMHDVTHERQVEEQLRQAQKMEIAGRLAGGVAHDFNNLLTVIMGRGELMVRRLAAGDPLHRDVELIQETAKRAAGLTRQLLVFSRKQVLTPRVLDLNAIVANMTRMLQRLIGEDIELVTVPGEGLGRVKTDAGQIEQVVLNLAVNARDAMPRGGRITITTSNVELDEAEAREAGVKPGPYVQLTLSDTGCGIAPEIKSHIFEPFFTTKGPEKGTGLGLSTVYGIITQSLGGIVVDSEPGCGATFKVYLPRIEAEVAAAESAATSAAPAGGRGTILLVEDEQEVRGLARDILASCGYTVIEARHGVDALAVAARHEGPIDLLLTDVIMPQMGGRELAERLHAARPETKVLFMSGYSDAGLGEHHAWARQTAFLEKPFSSHGLAEKVAAVLADGQAGPRAAS
jgi:PAS domain S-box-containing protein